MIPEPLHIVHITDMVLSRVSHAPVSPGECRSLPRSPGALSAGSAVTVLAWGIARQWSIHQGRCLRVPARFVDGALQLKLPRPATVKRQHTCIRAAWQDATSRAMKSSAAALLIPTLAPPTGVPPHRYWGLA